jgi:hypothetical protein
MHARGAAHLILLVGLRVRDGSVGCSGIFAISVECFHLTVSKCQTCDSIFPRPMQDSDCWVIATHARTVIVFRISWKTKAFHLHKIGSLTERQEPVWGGFALGDSHVSVRGSRELTRCISRCSPVGAVRFLLHLDRIWGPISILCRRYDKATEAWSFSKTLV